MHAYDRMQAAFYHRMHAAGIRSVTSALAVTPSEKSSINTNTRSNTLSNEPKTNSIRRP